MKNPHHKDSPLWGPPIPEKPVYKNIGAKTAWGLDETPNLENIHPKDLVKKCQFCHRKKIYCECLICPDCGELAEECGFCSDCDSHECSC